MRRFITIITLLWGVASCATTPPAPVANDYQRMSQSQFPARVTAIEFSDGGHIETTQAQSWGRWSFRIDESTVARFFSQDALRRIDVGPIICHNQIEGRHACYLALLREGNNWKCFFYSADPAFGRSNVYIACPSGLRLL